MQMGVFTVPPIGAGVWVEFEQGDPDYPIWAAASGASPAEVPALRPLVPPACPASRLQTTLQNSDRDQRPARARPAASCSRARPARSIIVNDTGIYIQNGKGASIMLVGPTVTVNQGALVITDAWRGSDRMPGFLLHVGATVLCAHGGRPADRAEPARAGQRPAGR